MVGRTALLPLEEGPCPSCTALLDQLDGAAEHARHQINFAVVAKTSLRACWPSPKSVAGVAYVCCPRRPTLTTALPRVIAPLDERTKSVSSAPTLITVPTWKQEPTWDSADTCASPNPRIRRQPLSPGCNKTTTRRSPVPANADDARAVVAEASPTSTSVSRRARTTPRPACS